MADKANFPNVGGAWNNDNGSIGVRLENGIRLTLWPNKYKQDGDTKPDFKVSSPLENAQTFGLIVNREETSESSPVDAENVDMNDLPF